MSVIIARVFLKGLETLQLRMQAHFANALELSRGLKQQAAVKRVYYCGFKSHRANSQDASRAINGGIVLFE